MGIKRRTAAGSVIRQLYSGKAQGRTAVVGSGNYPKTAPTAGMGQGILDALKSLRLGSYGEWEPKCISPTKHGYAEEGSYLIANSGVVGQLMNAILPVQFDWNGAPFIYVQNNDPTRSLMLDYVKISPRAANTAVPDGTATNIATPPCLCGVVNYAVVCDRYSRQYDTADCGVTATIRQTGISDVKNANVLVRAQNNMRNVGHDPNVVQSVQVAQASNTTVLTLTAPITAGNMLVVAGFYAWQITAITDSLGNTWKAGQSNTGFSAAVWYAYNVPGSAAGVTVTVTTTGGTGGNLYLAEYSGALASADPLDVHAVYAGVSGYPVVATLTTTTPGDVMIGAFTRAGTVNACQTPSVYRMNSGSAYQMVDVIARTAGINASTTPTMTSWGGVVAAFKPRTLVVQSAGASTAGQTTAAVFAGAQTAGNANFVTVSYSWKTTDPGIMSVTDTSGNVYTLFGSHTSPAASTRHGGITSAIYCCPCIISAGAGSNTVSVLIAGSGYNTTMFAPAITLTEWAVPAGWAVTADTAVGMDDSISTPYVAGSTVMSNPTLLNWGQTSGNILLVCVCWSYSAGDASPTVTDTVGNTYVAISGQVADGTYWLYALNIAPTGAKYNTVTAAFTTGGSSPTCVVIEVAGVNAANPLEYTFTQGTATGNNPSGTGTTVYVNDLGISVINAPNGYTLSVSNTVGTQIVSTYQAAWYYTTSWYQTSAMVFALPMAGTSGAFSVSSILNSSYLYETNQTCAVTGQFPHLLVQAQPGEYILSHVAAPPVPVIVDSGYATGASVTVQATSYPLWAGDTLLAVVNANNSTTACTAPTGGSLTWTRVTSVASAATYTAIYRAVVAAGSSNSTSFAVSSGGTCTEIGYVHLRGVGAVDTFVTGSGTASAPDPGNITPTNAGEMIVSVCGVSSSAAGVVETAGTGYTLLCSGTSTIYMAVEANFMGVSGSQTAAFGTATAAAQAWAAIAVSFKPVNSPAVTLLDQATAHGAGGITVVSGGSILYLPGDTLVVVVTNSLSSIVPAAPTDSAGNTYTLVASKTYSTTNATAIYACTAVVVYHYGSITFTGDANTTDIGFVHLRGVASIDSAATVSSSGASGTPNAGNITPTGAGEMILVALGVPSASGVLTSQTAGAGYAIGAGVGSGAYETFQTNTYAAAGSQSTAFGAGSVAGWASIAIALVPAPSFQADQVPIQTPPGAIVQWSQASDPLTNAAGCYQPAGFNFVPQGHLIAPRPAYGVLQQFAMTAAPFFVRPLPASPGARITGRGTLGGNISFAGEELVIVFGSTKVGGRPAVAPDQYFAQGPYCSLQWPVRRVSNTAPIVLGPGQSCAIHLWGQNPGPIGYEYEVGMWLR